MLDRRKQTEQQRIDDCKESMKMMDFNLSDSALTPMEKTINFIRDLEKCGFDVFEVDGVMLDYFEREFI